jgi:hypothetical protein
MPEHNIEPSFCAGTIVACIPNRENNRMVDSLHHVIIENNEFGLFNIKVTDPAKAERFWANRHLFLGDVVNIIYYDIDSTHKPAEAEFLSFVGGEHE